MDSNDNKDASVVREEWVDEIYRKVIGAPRFSCSYRPHADVAIETKMFIISHCIDMLYETANKQPAHTASQTILEHHGDPVTKLIRVASGAETNEGPVAAFTVRGFNEFSSSDQSAFAEWIASILSDVINRSDLADTFSAELYL